MLGTNTAIKPEADVASTILIKRSPNEVRAQHADGYFVTVLDPENPGSGNNVRIDSGSNRERYSRFHGVSTAPGDVHDIPTVVLEKAVGVMEAQMFTCGDGVFVRTGHSGETELTEALRRLGEVPHRTRVNATIARLSDGHLYVKRSLANFGAAQEVYQFMTDAFPGIRVWFYPEETWNQLVAAYHGACTLPGKGR